MAYENKEEERFFVIDLIGKDIVWFVTDIRIYPHEECDWLLGSASCQDISRAMIFKNEKRAERIANILSDQYDEFGYSGNYDVVPCSQFCLKGVDGHTPVFQTGV